MRFGRTLMSGRKTESSQQERRERKQRRSIIEAIKAKMANYKPDTPANAQEIPQAINFDQKPITFRFTGSRSLRHADY